MAFRSFKHNFHDALLFHVSVGPRREVELEIALDPLWNVTGGVVTVRLGAIGNFNEVRRFFRSIPPRPAPDAALGQIVALRYETRKPYPVLLSLSGVGEIVIEARNVSETQT